MTPLLARPVRPIRHSRSQSSANAGRVARNLTIVHAVAPAAFGGLERVVRSLAAGQIAGGHQVHVAAAVGPGGAGTSDHPFVAALREAGVSVALIETATRDYLGERRAVRDLCNRVSADILHTHGYRPDVVASGVAGTIGIPRVSTVHGFTGGDWKNRLYEELQRQTLRRFDAVIAVARSQLAPLVASGVSAERIHVLPNAWQSSPTLSRRIGRMELGAAEKTPHVGWVGRLSKEKGADLLVGAVALLGDLPLSVSILGDGPERPRLQALAAELGVADRIRWHGAVSEASRYFPSFDLFVLSSRTEGTPMVLFEAMAAETPIVAAAVGGVPDVITSAEGLLVPSGDKAVLAAAIRNVCDDPAAATMRAERARVRLEEMFSFRTWIARQDAIYQQLVHSTDR